MNDILERLRQLPGADIVRRQGASVSAQQQTTAEAAMTPDEGGAPVGVATSLDIVAAPFYAAEGVMP